MLHRAADDDPDQAPPPADSADVQEQIARFNERNSWTRRTPWQMIVDAPLLLRRLLSDLRRGDIQVFRELIRRGFQLKILVGALYVLSPVRAEQGKMRPFFCVCFCARTRVRVSPALRASCVSRVLPALMLSLLVVVGDISGVTCCKYPYLTPVLVFLRWQVDVVPEGRVGMIIGLLDDVLVILFFLFHITTVYRAILLSWDRARVARAASGTGTDTDEAGPIEPRDTDGVINPRDGFRGHAVVEGPGTAVFFAIFAGAMASFAGAGDGASGLAAVAAGVVAAVVTSANVNANAIPPLARDW